MDNEYYSDFIASCEKVIEKNTRPNKFELVNKESHFICQKGSAHRLGDSLNRSLEKLDEELNRFENLFSNSQCAVFWASDYNDVFSSLKKLFKTHKVSSVRLPNINASTIFRELGIKFFLRDEKIELREEGDIQFFAVDMMFSDTGSLLLLNQTNNTFSILSNSKPNVFFATIDCLASNSSWAEIIQQLLAYKNEGGRQDMILFKGNTKCENYLFIIDNQRTKILHRKEIRQAMTCLQCGRCNDVCPVYQTIGAEPYNNVFAGPVANIALPFLETIDSYSHVVYACTLCGRCEEVCPMSLPIRDMIISVRQHFFNDDINSKKYRRLMAAMRKVATGRKSLKGPKFLKRHLLYKHLSNNLRKNRSLPDFFDDVFPKS